MESPIFLLAKDPENDCSDLIFQRDGNLRLRVICLEDQEWHLNPEEMQLYAKKNNGEQLVFETIDYNHQEPGLIIEAIKWYANYIGNPEMEIEAELDE